MNKKSISTNTSMFKAFFTSIILVITLLFNVQVQASSEHSEEKAFNAGEMIIHHVSDAHSIHLIGDITIPLPVIIYTEEGIDVFSSSKFMDEHHNAVAYTSSSTGNTYELHHEKIQFAGAHDEHAHGDEHAEGHSDEHAKTLIDFSITKSVFGMLFIIFLMFLIFGTVARSAKKNKGKAPKGIQNVMEPLILFIRDEVVIPSMGKKNSEKYMPFLLTFFFFIFLCNMLGLIPFLGGFNITGTLSITIVLAALVFIVTTISGNKNYWGHILWPPGVPLPIKLILVPIELASIFIKPGVLMVRLTANIVAGHIIILAFVSLILIFGEQSAVAGYGVAVGSVAFMVFMFFIELLVAFLQAYVFTLLAALYFGDANQEAHH